VVQGTRRIVSLETEYYPGEENIVDMNLYSCSSTDAPEYLSNPRTFTLPRQISTVIKEAKV